MTATVRIVSARKESVARIPNDALRFRPPGQGKATGGVGEGATLWTLNSFGRPTARAVRLGLRGNAFTEIVAGDLKIGDRIVLRARRKAQRSRA